MHGHALIAESSSERREESAYCQTATDTGGHFCRRVCVVGNHDLGTGESGERVTRSLGVALVDDSRMAPRPEPCFPCRPDFVIEVEFVEQIDCRDLGFELVELVDRPACGPASSVFCAGQLMRGNGDGRCCGVVGSLGGGVLSLGLAYFAGGFLDRAAAPAVGLGREAIALLD
jgi:hypothetical protein